MTDFGTLHFNTSLTDLELHLMSQLHEKPKNFCAHFLADFHIDVDET